MADDRGMAETGRTRAQRIMRRAVVTAGALLIVLLAATASLFAAIGLGAFDGSPLRGDVAAARSDRPGMRVLFLGNSLTFMHDVPALLRQLVASDPSNRPLIAVRYAPGGSTLAQHARNRTVGGLIDSIRWDDVVLQESSPVASLDPAWRPAYMDAPARELVERVRAHGAVPVFFLTPGYATGSPASGFDSYSAMQDRLDRNYADVAAALSAPVIPVGTAWAEALTERPELALWEPDGVHPSLEGAYLDACVFYATLYNRSPASSFTAGLAPAEATFLQRVAASVAR